MELVLALLLFVLIWLLMRPRKDTQPEPPPAFYPTPDVEPVPTGVQWTANGPVLYYDGERPGQEEEPVWRENWRRAKKQADTDA